MSICKIYLPKSGTASEVAGDISDTMLRKKQIDSKTVISAIKTIFCSSHRPGLKF